MAQTDIGSTTISDLTNVQGDYSVDSVQLDVASEQNETTYVNTKWTQYLAYYKKIPELKKAIDALAIWSVGKGWTSDDRTRIRLDNITGWGEDTFNSIMWNMLITKKINGDSFAEIIRHPETGTLINIKPLDPGNIQIVTNKKGIIIRYEDITRTSDKGYQKFDPNDILHFSNDRVASEIHGTSVVEACEWTILARNQAMQDSKDLQHRNIVPVRIIEVDTDNTGKIASLKHQYEQAIKNKEVIIVPKGNVDIRDSQAVIQPTIPWIQYLENFFYQAVGVPRVIATSENFTEAASKVGFLTFEPIYTWEQTQIEGDLWNQLAIKVKFNRPPSLGGDLARDEAKDGSAAFQPNDAVAGSGE